MGLGAGMRAKTTMLNSVIKYAFESNTHAQYGYSG
jgi:hypothetical protein